MADSTRKSAIRKVMQVTNCSRSQAVDYVDAQLANIQAQIASGYRIVAGIDTQDQSGKHSRIILHG